MSTDPFASIDPPKLPPRVKKSLSLRQETWEMLESITRALGHEDMEETLLVLADLGVKAIQLTTATDRLLKMMSGKRQEIGDPCKTCGRRQSVYTQEAAVMLGREIPSLSKKSPK